MRPRHLHVLVVGDGVAGLASAAFLRQSGHDVSVFGTGRGNTVAGVFLPSNGVRVLATLGLDAVLREASSIARTRAVDAAGKLIQIDEHQADHPADSGPCALGRKQLLDALRKSAGLVDAGERAVVERVEAQGDRIRVWDDQRRDSAFDLVVGADGNESPLRRLVFGSAAPPSGQLVIRFVTARPTSVDPHEVGRILGPSASVWSVPFGGQLLAVSVVAAFSGDQARAFARGELDGLRGVLGAGGHAFLDAMLPGTMRIETLPSGVADRWSEGRVVLVGAAAHPLHPVLGQGAALALEDGRALQVALDRSPSVPEALVSFEAARRARVLAVHRASWELSVPSTRPGPWVAAFRGVLALVAPTAPPAKKLSALLSGGADLDEMLSHDPDLEPLSADARDLLAFLVKVGQVDGRFDETERSFVRASLQELGHYATASETAAVEREVVGRRMAELVQPFKTSDHAARARLIQLGVLLAAASGIIASEERKALLDAARALEVPRETYDKLVADALAAH